MIATSVSAAFTTNKVEETKDFYVTHLGAMVTFDCGFAIQDPNGITLYLYTDREPTEDFKKFYKT